MADLGNEPVLYADYVSRINKVIDYIDLHLGTDLSLEELADVAQFSKYHFHRIFFALMQETLFQYIQRLRLEKAASCLVFNPGQSITAIALDCGFSSQSAFARAFKAHYTMSASEWRKRPGANSNLGTTGSNLSQMDRNSRKDSSSSSGYDHDIITNEMRRMIMSTIEGKVEIKTLPAATVAYVRYVGAYQGNAELFAGLFNKLFTWAGARDLLRFPETQTMVIYHDDPDITDDDRLRMSVCLTVPSDTPVDGEIGKMQLPGGKYALVRFSLNSSQYGEAWNWVYGSWLPQSGYQPDDRPCFELYPQEGSESSDCDAPTVVDICVPIKPL